MTATNAVYMLIYFTLIAQVTAWTIDLPEVRKFYFERSQKQDEARNNESYDNIKGNSVHNSNDGHNYDLNKYVGIQNHGENKSKYADSYNNYESYMVRKVQNALQNGTVYLDGLRLSIERYIEVLENCSRLNLTTEDRPATSPLSFGNFTGTRDWVRTCRKATESSEHVRRLAELALWTTRRLQDVAFTAKYSKDASMEENELLLRLAWYLDKLAHLTGYDPNPEDHTTTAKPNEPSPAPVVPNFLPNISDEVKTAILNCLRSNSSEPATVRCALPIPQPALREIARMYNFSDNFEADSSSDTSGRVPRRLNDDTAHPSLEPELLLATDNKRVFPPNLTPVKFVQKRSITDSSDPLVKVLKYYAKHKTWVNSNPLADNFDDSTQKSEVFDVKNDLHNKKVQKRSINLKAQNLNKLENPLQDLTKYIKSKPNIHYNINKERFRAALELIHNKKILSNNKIKKLKKIFRYRRSPYDFEHHHHEHFIPHIPHDHVIKTHTDVHYDVHKDPAHVAKETVEKIKATIDKIHTKKVILHKKFEALKHILRSKRSMDYEKVVKPRIPEDPQRDLSYYVKNKYGTNENRDLSQAASVRASLEATLQRGNILVIERYGANYNPAVPNPFYAGLAESIADS